MCSSLVCTAPRPTNLGTGEDAYSVLPTYKDYIQALCVRNPSLKTLYSFLANPKARKNGCQATALDFRLGTSNPDCRQISDPDCLIYEIRPKTEGEHLESEHRIQGRVLIIEDLTAEIIQLLGSELDLDPLFLATHLHTVHRTGMQHQTPDDATLPSRLIDREYVNVSYHKPVTSDTAYPSGSRYSLDSAIDRKLVFIRSTSIGLAQHRVSIIKLRPSQDFWLCLILVDPPLGNTYFRSAHKDDPEHEVNLKLNPYLGTYENFMELPKFSSSEAWRHWKGNIRRGMLDDIIEYWMTALPECFDAADPSIQSLAYYPLKIVAAEWVKYIAIMQHCIKLYEYEGSQLNLDKFNMDLRELQGWRRRSMISQRKLRTVVRHLELHFSRNPQHVASIKGILEDYTHINSDIEDVGRRLENMLPVVTSLVQIIDARQSFAETANITRLTILALIFVPLSFVSGLFSMNSKNMPGSDHFWVYFAVAIPVTLGVVLIARPPTSEDLHQIASWASGTFKRRRRSTTPATDEKLMIDKSEAEWAIGRSPTMRR